MPPATWFFSDLFASLELANGGDYNRISPIVIHPNETKRTKTKNTFLTSCGDWIQIGIKADQNPIIFERLTKANMEKSCANVNDKQIEN